MAKRVLNGRKEGAERVRKGQKKTAKNCEKGIRRPQIYDLDLG
jgi:hypothetical protein